MNCPRDHTPLEPRQGAGFHAQSCPRCHGLFVKLDQPGLPSVSSRFLKPATRARVPLGEEDSAASPKTGHRMLAFKVRGVVIDYCPGENGVWLDAEELDKLEPAPGRAKRRKKTSGSPAVRRGSDDWIEWIDPIISSGFDHLLDHIIDSLLP